jgi:hypothetical protein
MKVETDFARDNLSIYESDHQSCKKELQVIESDLDDYRIEKLRLLKEQGKKIIE